MEEILNVMKCSAELAGTIEIGLNHMLSQLRELRYEESMQMLNDIIEGIVAIEQSIHPLMPQLPENILESLAVSLNEELKKTVSAYEAQDMDKVSSCVEDFLIPAFVNMKNEIIRIVENFNS